MKINWKLRFKNKATLAAIVATALLLAQQLGFELPSNISAITNTLLSIAVLVGLITDPTTKGFEDSERAMGYEVPK